MKRLCSVLATHEEIVLETVFVYPPIPIRSWDWFACDDNSYDGGDENPVSGEGRTENDAIEALFERLEDQ